MKALKTILMVSIGMLVLIAVIATAMNMFSEAFTKVGLYSFIFSRKVVGVIEKVERVQLNVALMQTAPGEKLNSELYSFAVAIKEPTGEIVTASAEDRQWMVVQVGQCAEAVYYPYPPWKFDKANTYFGARLEKLAECPK